MEPLISLLIVTYNSSSTIKETLESVKGQIYGGPIEVIVSDDCSSDNTVEVCQQWFNDNGNRFVSWKVIESPVNTGVSANFNRAILQASGEWAKILAGDDLLRPNCLSDNLSYTRKNEDAAFIFSQMHSFTVRNGNKELIRQFPSAEFSGFFDKSPEEQHQLLCLNKTNEIPAPTLFCRLDLLKENLYHEQYRYCEDLPQWFFLTAKGYRLSFMPVETVLYRESESLSRTSKRFYNPNFWATLRQFFYDEIAEGLSRKDPEEYHRRIKDFFMSDFAIHILRNKPNALNRLIYGIVYRLYK